MLSRSFVFVDSVTTATQRTSWPRSERSPQRSLTCTSTWIITVSISLRLRMQHSRHTYDAPCTPAIRSFHACFFFTDYPNNDRKKLVHLRGTIPVLYEGNLAVHRTRHSEIHHRAAQ